MTPDERTCWHGLTLAGELVVDQDCELCKQTQFDRDIHAIENSIKAKDKIIENLSTDLDRLREENARLKDAAEMLWVVLASVSGGDWQQQSAEWRAAAERWRDNYFTAAGLL